MRLGAFTKTCVAMALCGALNANAIQPVDVGLEPVREQVHEVQEQMYAVADQFSSTEATQSERNELGRVLVKLRSERKALEAEIKQTMAFSPSPLVTYTVPAGTAK